MPNYRAAARDEAVAVSSQQFTLESLTARLTAKTALAQELLHENEAIKLTLDKYRKRIKRVEQLENDLEDSCNQLKVVKEEATGGRLDSL